jgi:hypothetical protein
MKPIQRQRCINYSIHVRPKGAHTDTYMHHHGLCLIKIFSHTVRLCISKKSINWLMSVIQMSCVFCKI